VLQALRRDYVPPALLDALRVSVMAQWELYFFDAAELDDDSSIADDGTAQRKRKRTETEGESTPAGENGTVCVCVVSCRVVSGVVYVSPCEQHHATHKLTNRLPLIAR
jgi:hypothetical protein